MKKIIINKTILLFLNINDMISFKKNELLKIKQNYLESYDNCIIYNYFDLKNHKNIIKDKINKLKFINQQKINARDCIVKIISRDEKNTFLNQYHIQGTDKSQISYGAYYNNELISVMCFDSIQGVNGGINENEYNLSRFAIKSNIIVVGILPKILKIFINQFKPIKIVSFGDLNFINRYNNIYIQNKFKLDKTISPDYKIYLKNKDNLFHKFTYGNKFLNNKNIDLSVKKEVTDNSFKVWNCGKIKYELFIDDNNQVIFGFIYKIKNIINNKIYIGQTTRKLNKRIYEYKAAFKYGSFYNQHLLNAYNKYGWDCFEFSVIDTAETIDELNNKEIGYIQEYKSNQKEFGYNIESDRRNAIPDTETINKMSKSHLGAKQTEVWINKRIAKAGSMDAQKYGRKKSKEDKEYLSSISPKYWLGKNRDNKTKQKISETKKKNGLSEKQKNIICKKVYKINIKTNKVVEYESTSNASIFEKVNQSTISRWCKSNKIINDFLWKY
jgi:group I intron endonuclease